PRAAYLHRATTGRRTRGGHQAVAGGATLEVHRRASHSDAKSGRRVRSDVTTVSADRPRVASPILLAKLAYGCIIGGRQGRPERFVHPRHDDEQRPVPAFGIKSSRQPAMSPCMAPQSSYADPLAGARFARAGFAPFERPARRRSARSLALPRCTAPFRPRREAEA